MAIHSTEGEVAMRTADANTRGGAPEVSESVALAVRRALARVRVDDVMTRDPVTIDRDATLADAVDALLRGGFRHLPVIEGKRLVGMLSERDLRTHLGADLAGVPRATLEALSEPVSEAMTPDPISVRSGTPLADVLDTFAVERVGAIAVVDGGDELVGIISYVDLLVWLRDAAQRAGEASLDA